MSKYKNCISSLNWVQRIYTYLYACTQKKKWQRNTL